MKKIIVCIFTVLFISSSATSLPLSHTKYLEYKKTVSKPIKYQISPLKNSENTTPKTVSIGKCGDGTPFTKEWRWVDNEGIVGWSDSQSVDNDVDSDGIPDYKVMVVEPDFVESFIYSVNGKTLPEEGDLTSNPRYVSKRLLDCWGCGCGTPCIKVPCDNCIGVSNPDQKDSDNDGVGDVCEGTNPPEGGGSGESPPCESKPGSGTITK